MTKDTDEEDNKDFVDALEESIRVSDGYFTLV
jgi:hypothetical protein